MSNNSKKKKSKKKYIPSKKTKKSKKKYNEPQFNKINKTLDDEHAEIFKTIDKLYDVCYNHWKTEDKMYKDGLKQMPDYHQNVSQLWKEHSNEHENLLKQIKNMKKHIIRHINEQDSSHFHWT